MYNRKLKASSALGPVFKKRQSFAWRKLVAAVSILGVVIFLLWLRYQLLLNFDTWERSLQKNTDEKRPEIQQTPDNAIQQRIASNYCQIKDCSCIDCSSISKNLDPGTVASDFIETKFKIDCKSAETVKLSFDDCNFPENKLRKNWLRTNVSINELTFKNCALDEIEDDIFSELVYKNTRKIILVGNHLHSLRRGMFRHLNTLNELSIQSNIIKLAEFNLLADVADSLSILELYGVINDRETLRNITGGSVLLSSLQILSINGNSLPVIDGELFAGVPSVQSLYLDNCKIEKVAQDTFKPLASSIIQLHLNYNNIVTLPEGLFDPILHFKLPFRLTAQNNPWHCDCSLKWIQDFVGTSTSIVVGPPSCKTPEINAGKSFATANFCYESNTTNPVTPITSTIGSTKHEQSPTTMQTTDTTKESINLTCNFVTGFPRTRTSSRKLMSSDFLQIKSQFPRFNVSEKLDQGILVSLQDLDEGITLLWFSNDVEGSIGCARNVKRSYLVQGIDPQTAYTICLLTDNAHLASPLNCLALTTSPTYDYRTWLRNADKSLISGVSIFLLISALLVGAIVAFLMIRRYPTLLRGSKRVMLVKRRHVDAIVLPKGVDIDEEKLSTINRKPQEDGYITPLPPVPIPGPRRPRVSRISVQSDGHSYVLPVEPTDTWRLTLFNGELERQKSEAPPLPPHRNNAVPSLSSTVDVNEECAGYYIPTV